jgi:hypothetical protein
MSTIERKEKRNYTNLLESTRKEGYTEQQKGREAESIK